MPASSLVVAALLSTVRQAMVRRIRSSASAVKEITGMAPSAMATTRAAERSFPGAADQVGEARAFLARFLADCPAADDAVLLASELSANAIVHSASGWPGGMFTIRAWDFPGNYVYVEVEDRGSSWDGRLGPAACPHGLYTLHALATTYGADGDERAWTVWFTLGYPNGRQPARPFASAGPALPAANSATEDLEALERLVAVIDDRDYAAAVIDHDGGSTHLEVTSRHHPSLADQIYVQNGWYWHAWAERIAATTDAETAAATIARVLAARDPS